MSHLNKPDKHKIFPELMSQEEIEREWQRAENIITVTRIMETCILIVALGAMSIFIAHAILQLLIGAY